MAVTTSTHLNFTGNARQALEFYHSVFGGQLTVATYGDFGMPADVPGADQVVWGQVANTEGFVVMAYDVPPLGASELAAAQSATRRENGVTLTNQSFFLSVRGASIDEVEPLWNALVEGATVVEQFGPAQWAPAFGMLTDRFGVTWIVDVAAPYDPS